MALICIKRWGGMDMCKSTGDDDGREKGSLFTEAEQRLVV